ncbi:MAG TPA: glycosyltransferase family 39 protein [Rhizomicrobium sp.]|nr:glycosyltransferase family 39 protein [Rhizomicrobium sp.]
MARTEHLLAALVFLLGVVCLFLTAPHHGEFWWSDSPRHALNGVFVKDLIANMPADPKQWAMQYYIKYPALTILFYPPLFYVISAPFYAIFGVSQATGLAVVMLHYIALALGLFVLARRWTSANTATLVGLSAMAAPGLALWGRQIMLEVPSLAFAVWAMVALQRYGENKRSILLYVTTFLLLCASYTKLNAVFLFAVVALTVLSSQKADTFKNKHVWIAAALTAFGLVPLIVLTLKFGAANVQSVMGIADSRVARDSIAGWIWYAQNLPGLIWWPLLVLAVATPILFAAGILKSSLSRTDTVLLVSWFVVGYVALSLIDLKEARHALLILPPVLISAGLASNAVHFRRAGEILLTLVVVATGIYTWQCRPNPLITGYRQAAVWIGQHAPRDAIVVFSGKRDGSFIFNMRTLENRRDITTVRSDKLLLSIAVRRELGVKENNFSEREIADLLDRDGVSYVVAQDDFWTDLPVMKRLQNVLRSSHFQKVAEITVTSNVPAPDHILSIYRNLGEVNPHPGPLQLDLPIIGKKVKGKLGSQSTTMN